jgi:ketosteroid isomerase-like protein
MNIIKQLLFVLLCIPLFTVQAVEDDRSKDREELKKILYSIEDSLNKVDMDTLLSHFDENAVLSFMTTEVASGKEGLLAYYKKMFNLPEAPLTSYHTEASLDGPAHFHGNTIVASGRTQDSFTLSDGRAYSFNTRWVATAIKKDNQWKVISLDFSVNPFENVILDEMGRQLINYALLAFLAGLIIMFIITRVLTRNAKGYRV